MKLHKQILAVVAAAVVAAGGVPVVVSAQNTNAQEGREQAQQRQETAEANAEERREATQTRLKDAKLRTCQNRERAIKNIMARVSDRNEKQIKLFTTIADRAKAFYAENNLSLNNYDDLVAAVNAKRAAAQTAAGTVKNSSGTFACDGEDPRGTADGFKADMKAQIKALQEYRTAVKDLIAGVKSAQNAAEAENGDQ